MLRLNVTKTFDLITKGQLWSALRKVNKYILANQTIAYLEDEHSGLRNQTRINWLFTLLS